MLTYIYKYCILHLNNHSSIGGEFMGIIPKEELLYDLAELFKVFGDSTRIKILYVLYTNELPVSDIAERLNMTISAISHQLKILKQAKLVKYRKSGKNVIYSLADDHVRTMLGQGMDHITE